ncbi:hypothetical protein PYCCODRAFT_692564 [Trametes coccinea BRFM310]|uniref:Uncharacterized protein n=1 Tax=Trametes coccinea (strain BRFM310) TaxID=1353009 RepID=A0A1Y2IHC8_TRAC3|nr:hypothetical protein PYCCODRAFT_692564 [Trametes coccinea BRFM310]
MHATRLGVIFIPRMSNACLWHGPCMVSTDVLRLSTSPTVRCGHLDDRVALVLLSRSTLESEFQGGREGAINLKLFIDLRPCRAGIMQRPRSSCMHGFRVPRSWGTLASGNRPSWPTLEITNQDRRPAGRIASRVHTDFFAESCLSNPLPRSPLVSLDRSLNDTNAREVGREITIPINGLARDMIA